MAPPGPRALRTVYTAMHGVGAETLRAAMDRSGFDAPHEVVEQVEPDPDFPTVAFPNPEEPGALDLSLDLARRVDADLVLANDPDRSEEHTSELQSLMRISYAVFCLQKKPT